MRIPLWICPWIHRCCQVQILPRLDLRKLLLHVIKIDLKNLIKMNLRKLLLHVTKIGLRKLLQVMKINLRKLLKMDLRWLLPHVLRMDPRKLLLRVIKMGRFDALSVVGGLRRSYLWQFIALKLLILLVTSVGSWFKTGCKFTSRSRCHAMNHGK